MSLEVEVGQGNVDVLEDDEAETLQKAFEGLHLDESLDFFPQSMGVDFFKMMGGLPLGLYLQFIGLINRAKKFEVLDQALKDGHNVVVVFDHHSYLDSFEIGYVLAKYISYFEQIIVPVAGYMRVDDRLQKEIFEPLSRFEKLVLMPLKRKKEKDLGVEFETDVNREYIEKILNSLTKSSSTIIFVAPGGSRTDKGEDFDLDSGVNGLLKRDCLVFFVDKQGVIIRISQEPREFGRSMTLDQVHEVVIYELNSLGGRDKRKRKKEERKLSRLHGGEEAA